MSQTEYQKGYNSAKTKYLAEIKKLKYEYEHQIHDINGIYPLNIIQDIIEEYEYQYDFSVKQIKTIMQERLTDRENKVLELRYGRKLSLEEVGKEFDVTRERIRQIETRAIRKLRHPQTIKRMSVVSYDNWNILQNENMALKEKLDEYQKIIDNQNSTLVSFGEKEVNSDTLDVLKKNIDELELSVRSHNCLARKRLTTVKDIVDYANDNNHSLRSIRNLGKKSMFEIDRKLKELGIDLELIL